ncbi:P4HTM [Symbiodinium sp. CCMP2592]|nr:P4HTM [Symbiodinium sp. CCMP2592]
MAMHFGGVKSASLPHAEAILAGITEQGGWAMVHASEELRRNAEFVLSAVIQDGGCLMYASEELCGDEQVVLAAVEQDGNAMRYASPALKSDPVFALEAIKKNSEAILYISRDLRQDPHFTLQAALSGCSRDLLDPRLRVWLEQRDELLARMRTAIDDQDVFGVREVPTEFRSAKFPSSMCPARDGHHGSSSLSVQF